MVYLFIFIWSFMTLTAWVVSATTAADFEDAFTNFKMKSVFYWIAIALSFFAGYYLTK